MRYNITMKHASISGNVLFIILVAIGLFAALAAAVMNSEGGGKNAGSERAALYANDIALFAGSVEQAVGRMFARGISESDLCFDLDGATGGDTRYEGPAGCATIANRVFHPQGGGISYQAPSDRYLDPSFSSFRFYGEYLITDQTSISHVPPNGSSSTTELMILLPYVTKEICIALNDMVTDWPKGIDPYLDSATSIENRDNYRYQGTFIYARVISNSTYFDRVTRGCYRQGSGQWPNNAYIAYFTLRAR